MQASKRLGNVLSLTFVMLTIGSVFSASATSFSDANWRQPVNVLGSDGQQGALYVYGTLTESACRLSMDSAYQAVNLGNISTADLQKWGDKGRPVQFDIDLLDCLYHDTDTENFRTGSEIWSTMQPAVKIRFLSPTIKDDSNLIEVLGAKGVALQISDQAGKVLPIGVETASKLLALNNDTLTYYVTPVRTSSNLEAGQYHAVINFELIYD